MGNFVLYSVLAFIFLTTTLIGMYTDNAIIAGFWGFSSGIWTALAMQAWHFRHD